jgi:hypothetical protein
MTESIGEYQHEQLSTLVMVRRHLDRISRDRRKALESAASEYFAFRKERDIFLQKYFADVCTRKCFQNRLSACCSREGIITFFADMVANALVSSQGDLDRLDRVLRHPNRGVKCIYLGPEGCLWRLKPVVCDRFLCDSARKRVFTEFPRVHQEWKTLKKLEKRYTWPDRPVLFDDLEKLFLDAGYTSPLMYLHNSPGLLRVKRLAGLTGARSQPSNLSEIGVGQKH